MPPPTPICPKCGYDQSGTIATWSTQCPTQGTCPECGFEFSWANIFDPNRASLPWYVEHITHKRQLVSRTFPTLLRLFNPIKFWKVLTLLLPVNLRVLLLWYATLFLVLHSAASISYAVAYYHRIYARPGYWSKLFDSKGIYAYPELAFNAFFRNIVEMRSQAGALGLSKIQIDFHGWMSVANLILRPASLSIGINFMWLIVLLVIPTTRRLAKIRRAHVYRAFLLSMVCTLTILQTTRIDTGSGFQYWRMHTELYGYRPMLQLLVIWQLIFWPAAIIQGWKIKPAKLLIALGTIAAVLAGLLLNISIFILPDLIN